MPIRIAFWRNEPTVRFVNFAIFSRGVLALECDRSSFSCAFVNSRRTGLFLVFFATWIPSLSGSRLTITTDHGHKSSLTALASPQLARQHPRTAAQAPAAFREYLGGATLIAARHEVFPTAQIFA